MSPRHFDVYPVPGRLTPLVGGRRPPNRISQFFSHLTEQWLVVNQRCDVRLPAPSGSRIRYALTLTPDHIFARCQETGTLAVHEQHFEKPAGKQPDVRQDVSWLSSRMNETFRHRLERGYGWPAQHGWLPQGLPLSAQQRYPMEEFQLTYGNVTLVFSEHLLMVTSWGAAERADQPPRLILGQPFRWRGVTGYGVTETETLLKNHGVRLAFPWPLTGKECP